jgi:hypothetical protein
VGRSAAFDQIVRLNPSLLTAVEPRGLARGATNTSDLLHNQNVARIAFHWHRVLLRDRACHPPANLDRFGGPRRRSQKECGSKDQRM